MAAVRGRRDGDGGVVPLLCQRRVWRQPLPPLLLQVLQRVQPRLHPGKVGRRPLRHHLCQRRRLRGRVQHGRAHGGVQLVGPAGERRLVEGPRAVRHKPQLPHGWVLLLRRAAALRAGPPAEAAKARRAAGVGVVRRGGRAV